MPAEADWVPSGSTRVAAVIGDPVRHSLSPTIHNAGFRALGLDWVYAAFEVAEGRAADAPAAMRALGLGGLSVTMPHKAAVAAACDVLTPDAERLQSVNCVAWTPEGALLGDSTDGAGFVRSLGDAGVDPLGQSVVVLGAGGAARAVALALGRAGASVAITARRPDALDRAAAVTDATAVAWEARSDAAGAADIVVNATPIGMGVAPGAVGEPPVAVEALADGTVVADLVYHPLVTGWLAAAAARQLTTVDGLGMLVHQAAIAFERWTGADAPVAAMSAAARAAIATPRG